MLELMLANEVESTQTTMALGRVIKKCRSIDEEGDDPDYHAEGKDRMILHVIEQRPVPFLRGPFVESIAAARPDCRGRRNS